jgi:S-formylglutathione hydrolase FrmB
VAGPLALLVGLAVSANWYAGWVPNLEAAQIRLGLPDTYRPAVHMATDAPPIDQIGTKPITDDSTPIATVDMVPDDLEPERHRAHRGGIERFELPTEAKLNLEAHEVWIYTPPGYDPSGKVAYPVAYLTHGSPGAADDWMATGGPAVFDAMIARHEIAPMIMVAPGMNAVGVRDSGCLDATKPGGSQLETFFYDMVKPWVENHFPVATNRAYTAVGGMSMGGYCAIDQGLRHADQFATILSFLPYGEPGSAGGYMKKNQAEIDAVTPLKYLPTIKQIDTYPVAVWFGVGDSEVNKQVGKDAAQMTEMLRARGQVVETYIAPNQGHTWKMTIASLPNALRFWEKQLTK